MTMRHGIIHGHSSNRVIGEALQRSAAAFNASGTDLNKSIALVTTSNAVVQDPASVGTMFKTMSARIRGASTELQELGEEEDEYTKTTSKLRDLVKGLTDFDIMKDENTFKDIYDIIVGIGEEWQNLTDIEKASLTEALGGKRGVNTLSAVLNNIDMLKDAYATAEGAEGSAMREQENYAQSVQYSIDRAKASLEQLANDFLSSDFLKGAIEAANTLLQILDKIVASGGSVVSILGALAGLSIFKGLVGADSIANTLSQMVLEGFTDQKATTNMGTNILRFFKNIGNNKAIQTASKGAGAEAAEVFVASVGQTMSRSDAIANGFVEAVELADKAATKAAIESGGAVGGGFLSGLSATIGTGGMVALGVAGAAAVAGLAYAAYQHEEEKIRKQADAAAEELQKSQQQMDDYIANYQELYDQMNNPNNTDAETYAYKEQIYELQQKIISTYGEQASGVNLVNGQLETQLSILKNIAQYNGDENIAKNQKAYNKATKEMEKVRTFQIGTINTSGDADAIKASKDIMAFANKLGVKSIENAWGVSFEITANAEDAEEKLDQFEKQILELKEKNTNNEGYSASIDQLFTSIADSTGGKKIESVIEKWGDAYNAKLMHEIRNKSGDLIQEYSKAIDELNMAYTAGDDEAVAKAEEAYAKVAESKDKLINSENGEKYASFFDDKQIDQSAKSLYNYKKQIDDLDASLFSGMDSVDFKNAMDNYLKGKSKTFTRQGTGRQAIVGGPEELSDFDRFLQQTADTFGLASMSGEEYASVIFTIAKALSDANLIQDSFNEDIKSNIVDLTEFNNQFASSMAGIDNINAALVNSWSGKGLNIAFDAETGEMTGDVVTLTKQFEKLAGFQPDKLFRRMATGVKIDTKELNKLQKQQDAITRQNFAREQELLTKQLSDAYVDLAKAKTDSEKSDLLNQIADIEAAISKVKDAEAAYNGATSAYQKWLNAQSAGEQGDIYDNTRSTAKSRFKELHDNALVGTEEYRALAELFTGQDYSTAGVDELNAAYDQFNQTIEGTDKSVASFFEEGPTGVNNFVGAMLDLKFAAKDVDGNISWEALDLSKVAETFGTSVDVIEMNMRKLKDYGWNITWFSDDQIAQIKNLNKELEDNQTRMEKINSEASKQVDMSLFDQSSLHSVEDYENRIEALKEAQLNPELNDAQIKILQEELDDIEAKLEIINNPAGGRELNVTNVNAATATAQELVDTVEQINSLNSQYGLNIDVEGDEKVQQLADILANDIPPEVKTAFGLSMDATAEDFIKAVMDGTLSEKLTNVESTTASVVNAGPSIQRPTENKVTKNTTENDTVNKTTNISKDIKETEEHETHKIDFQTNAAEATGEVSQFKSEVSEIQGTVHAEIQPEVPTDPIESAQQKADELNKTVTVTIKAPQGELDAADAHIASIDGKTATISIGANTSPIDLAIAKYDNIPSKIISFTYQATNSPPAGAHVLNGTAHAFGTAFGGKSYARGNWGLPQRQTALTGELGKEIVVDPKTGTWQTVGDHGAEFVDLPKGAIVFNHLQSEQLLKNGYTFGRAHVGGTAYLGGMSSGSGKTIQVSTTTTSSSGGGGGGNNGGGNTTTNVYVATPEYEPEIKSKKKIKKSYFDWIEQLLDYFNKTFEEFKTIGEYYTTFTYQNSAVNQAIDNARKLMDVNKKAAKAYDEQAATSLYNAKYSYTQKVKKDGNEKTVTKSARLFTTKKGKKKGKYSYADYQKYMSQLANGTLKKGTPNFEKLPEDLKSALSDADEYLNKAIESRDQIVELRKEIYDLSQQKLDNIIDDFDNLIEKVQSANDLLESQNKLYDRRIKLVGKEYYKAIQKSKTANLNQQIANDQDMIIKKAAEITQLQIQIEENRKKDGFFFDNSEEYVKMEATLNKLNQEINELELNIYEAEEALRTLNWLPFTNAIGILDHLNTQLEATMSLFSDLTTFDDAGAITAAGISQMNIYASELSNSREHIARLKQAIDALNKERKNDFISQEKYDEEMHKYQEEVLSAANNTKKYRDAIISLIKDGINKETEAMSKLIDKQKESLRRRKEENDYAKQVRDSQKEINELRRQEAALIGDTTQSAMAQRIKLQAEIRKKEEDLASKQRDHQYDMEVQGLDDLNTKFTETQEARIKELEASLEEQTKAIDNALIFTATQYKDTYDILNGLMKEYGITFEDSIIKPWESAGAALANYVQATTPFDDEGAIQTKIANIKAGLTGLGEPIAFDIDSSAIDTLQKKLEDLIKQYNEAVITIGKGTKVVSTTTTTTTTTTTHKPVVTENESKTRITNTGTGAAVNNPSNSSQSSSSAKPKSSSSSSSTATQANPIYRTSTFTSEAAAKAYRDIVIKAGGYTVGQVVKDGNKWKVAVFPHEGGKAQIKTVSGTTATKPSVAETGKSFQSKPASNAIAQALGIVNNAPTQAKTTATDAAAKKKAEEAAAAAKKKADENKMIVDIINSGASRKKTLTDKEKKDHVALWEYIATKYGRTATNAMYKSLGSALGIKVSSTPKSGEKDKILSALKSRGLQTGAYRVSSDGWHLTDEEGIGSEAILTKEGVLRQLDAKDTVFNAKQREQLWNLSKMDLSSLGKLSKSGIGGNVNMHYDSLLTVNGNVDDSTLPKLQELLKMASEYTQKDMKKGLMKLGHN